MVTYLPNKTSLWKLIPAFGAVCLIWGSTYMAIMIALKCFPPFTLAGLRFLIAGLLLLGFCKLQGEKIPSTRIIIRISFTGILLLFFGSGSAIWVEQHIDSSQTAVIWATLPIWFVLLNKKLWPAYFLNLKSIVGPVVGFIGVILLIANGEEFDPSGNKVISYIIAFCGTIIYAAGSLYMKNKPVETSPTLIASVQLVAAGLLSLIVCLILHEPQSVIVGNLSSDSILSLIYLIIMGSMIAYLSYVWLISRISPVIVGTYTYVNPVIAVILGRSVLFEPFTFLQVISLFLILAGVSLVNIYKPKH